MPRWRYFRNDPTAARAAEAGAAVRACGDVVTNHLAHEERDLEPLMAERLTSAPMKVASTQVRRASKGEAGDFFAWLLDGADADAEAALRRQMPTAGPVRPQPRRRARLPQEHRARLVVTAQTMRRTTLSGACFMTWPSGAQGHVGIAASTTSRSMALTSAREPVSVSTMSRASCSMPSFISEAM